MRPTYILVSLSVLLPSAALAQGMDIVHQDILVDLADAYDVRAAVDATINLTGATSSIDTVSFGLPVLSVSVNELLTEAGPHPQAPSEALRIPLPEAGTAGDVLHVHIELQGEPACDYGGYAACFRTADEAIFPATPSFHLVNMWAIDGFTADLSVRVPEGFVVLAGEGAPLEQIANGDRTQTWRFTQAHEGERVYVYAVRADLVDEMTSIGGFPVRAYLKKDEAEEVHAKVEELLALASEVVPLYEEMFGDLGFEEAHIVVVPDDFYAGGMGLLGTVFYAHYIVDELDYLITQGVAHELGHSWWGGLSSSGDFIDGAFMNEALAEYSAWRALGTLYGDEVRTAGTRMNSVWYMYGRPGDDDIAPLDEDVYSSPLYVYVTYHKGSSVLRTLEEQAGEVAFNTALRALVATGYGHTSVGALIDEVEEASGYDATADVAQWLESPGFPRLRVWSAVGPDGRVELQVSSQGDFSYSLPVRFLLPGGERVEDRLPVVSGGSTHEWTLSQAPLAVELDPRWTVVREIAPGIEGDVTLDGLVDAADLIEVALHQGACLPNERRVDGGYDPLWDVEQDFVVDEDDLQTVLRLAAP